MIIDAARGPGTRKLVAGTDTFCTWATSTVGSGGSARSRRGKGPALRPAMSLGSHELAECHPPSCLL